MNASRTGYDYKLGSQVSYNCHHGYTTVGVDAITCIMGHDGKPVWDKSLPSCKGRNNTIKSCIRTNTMMIGSSFLLLLCYKEKLACKNVDCGIITFKVEYFRHHGNQISIVHLI